MIGTMGNGEFESCSNPDDAFTLQSRTHEQTGKDMMIAGTSCRIVNFDTLHKEIHSAGLELPGKWNDVHSSGFSCDDGCGCKKGAEIRCKKQR